MNQVALPAEVPVVIAGGGPVGLVMSALLTEYGIANVVLEADEGYCEGSRAICISRRSLEILGWCGAEEAVTATGLGWTAGRSYYRDQEVLRFEMPHDPTQRFDPMVNIQQYYIEEFAHQAMQRRPEVAQVVWGARVSNVEPGPAGVTVHFDHAGGSHQIQAQWLVAADGGRSTVRDLLGLTLEGMQYDGRYVIVDIEQESQRPTERLAWFDPPSNPGSTILMHRQPGNVWRIDYQIRDDEDPAEAVKPENVLPRVQSHLEMIGEDAPWKPLWISLYNAKCLTLNDYRHDRVLFVGDAGHLVPIFGVRGLNSGLDDAGNLAWKLAWVLRGNAPHTLLDSFSVERVHATRQNIAYGAKSTEFMAPPTFAYQLMREATLRLALVDPTVRSLINPRQTSPISYDGSSLNLADGAEADGPGAAPGQPAPELQMQRADETRHLSEWFGKGFVLLAVEVDDSTRQALEQLVAASAHDERGLPAPALLAIGSGHDAWSVDHAVLQARYGIDEPRVLLLRPDGYVMGRWHAAQAVAAAGGALAPYYPAVVGTHFQEPMHDV